jgi:uncharacterized protein YhjY with autotransporter beta-barrel domain
VIALLLVAWPGARAEAQLEVTIGDAQVVEGDAGIALATFAVTINAIPSSLVSAEWATEDETAEAGADYQASFGTVTFSGISSPSQTISVPVLGDTVPEGDETFRVVLFNLAGVTSPDPTGVATIVDDDAVEVTVGPVEVTEGDTGTTGAAFSVTVPPLSAPLDLHYATADGTAVAGEDYEAGEGDLSFTPAGPTTQTVTVPVLGDTRVEPDEDFRLVVSGPPFAVTGDVEGVATILDDDVSRVSIDDARIVEGNAGTSGAVFTVSVDNLSQEVTVSFATRDGTATAPGDYLAASGSLTFPIDGAPSQTVVVPIAGDTLVEEDETFTVELTGPGGAVVLDRAVGLGTILDDDGSTLAFTAIRDVAEGAGRALVTVTREGGTALPARATVRATAGTAAAGEDFTPAERTLAWGAGEDGPRSFEVEILDDNRVEDRETVVVTLAGIDGATLAGPGRVEIGIVDDDQPEELALVGEDRVLSTVDAEAELAVRVSPPVAGAVIRWEIVEGDATFAGGGEAPPAASGRTTAQQVVSDLTDETGLSRQSLVLPSEPGVVRVVATLLATGQAVEFVVMVEGDLRTLFGPGDPGEGSLAGVLDLACVPAGGELEELCDYLFGLGDDDQRRVVREVTPREAAAQGNLVLGQTRLQFRNVGARLAALRRAKERQQEEIALVLDDVELTVHQLRYELARYRREEEWVADRVAQAVARAGLQQEEAPAPPAPTAGRQDAPIDTESRLGAFLTGRVAFGERDDTAREEGFDADIRGLTAGLDYRLGPGLVVGGALGWFDTEVDLVRDGGTIAADGFSLAGYGTWFRDALHVEGIVAYGRNDFEQRRHLDLPQPFRGETRLVARADPGGDQLGVVLGLGYELGAGAHAVEGYGRASWVDASIDRYRERGAGPFALEVREQALESLLSETGVNWSYAASMTWGILQPSLRASWLHELGDDSRLLRGRFVADPQALEFVVPTDRPDRDFFNVGVGLTATTFRGRSFYLLYDTDVERDDIEVRTVTFGLRLEL